MKTIRDFGNQFSIHGDLDEDYWCSDEMFIDHFPHEFDIGSAILGKTCLEVGAGSGRIIKMISKFNPKSLIAVEPSKSFRYLLENTKNIPNLSYENHAGDKFNATNLDTIFSLGVIHHIPDPDPVIAHIYDALKPGGMFICWVYGKENQRVYVFFQNLIRKFTSVTPDFLLNYFSYFLAILISIYCKLLSNFDYPMKNYFESNFLKCSLKFRKYIIFDQLNPSYSKYYTRKEIKSLLIDNKFKIVNIYHRNLYSWTIIGLK